MSGLTRRAAVWAAAGLALSAATIAQTSTPGAAPPAGEPAPTLIFPADTPVAVQVSLWPLGLNSGRDSPVFHNFMAQLVFSGESAPVTCALRMPEPDDALAPGESKALAIRCALPFKVAPGRPEFQMRAGGKVIGKGQLRAAALAQVMAAAAPVKTAETPATAASAPSGAR